MESTATMVSWHTTAWEGWKLDAIPARIAQSRIVDLANKYWTRDVSTPEIGCWTSHVRTIQNHLHGYLLVLEDDAVTEDNFLFQVKRTICELEGLEWDFIDFGTFF